MRHKCSGKRRGDEGDESQRAWLNCDSDSWSTMNCLQQAAHAKIFNTFTVRGSVLL
jgi:hypothetical protein